MSRFVRAIVLLLVCVASTSCGRRDVPPQPADPTTQVQPEVTAGETPETPETVPDSPKTVPEKEPQASGDGGLERPTSQEQPPDEETFPTRTWEDITGNYRVEATYLEFRDGKVRLKKADGQTMAIPMQKLSQADQEFVSQQTPALSAPHKEVSSRREEAPPAKPESQNAQEPEKTKTAGLRTESVTIDGKRITIEYTNPDSKGRTRLADVVTFGKVWEGWSAVLKSEGRLKFGETHLDAGVYRLFIVPESTDKWQLIVTKNQENYDKKSELLSVVMRKGSSGRKDLTKDMKAYLIRVGSQPVDLGISILRMRWLDAEVETLFYGGMMAK